MGELVVMKNYDVFTTSLIISENLNLKHENVIKLIKKYSYVDNLRVVQTRKVSTKGRAIIDHLLTEEQALILVSMMKNTDEVIKFKVNYHHSFCLKNKTSNGLKNAKTLKSCVVNAQILFRSLLLTLKTRVVSRPTTTILTLHAWS